MSDGIAKIPNGDQFLGAGNDSEFFAKVNPVDKCRGILTKEKQKRFKDFLSIDVGNSCEFRGQGIHAFLDFE
jgi:hypothetical protein